MDYNDFADTIIGLKNEDLELRDKLILNEQIGKGYDEEMEKNGWLDKIKTTTNNAYPINVINKTLIYFLTYL